jgi:energy-converting hydrogenase A subunit M
MFKFSFNMKNVSEQLLVFRTEILEALAEGRRKNHKEMSNYYYIVK